MFLKGSVWTNDVDDIAVTLTNMWSLEKTDFLVDKKVMRRNLLNLYAFHLYGVKV